MHRVLCMRAVNRMAAAAKTEHGVASALKDVQQRIAEVRERASISREVRLAHRSLEGAGMRPAACPRGKGPQLLCGSRSAACLRT